MKPFEITSLSLFEFHQYPLFMRERFMLSLRG
jgi:hypothetical protein